VIDDRSYGFTMRRVGRTAEEVGPPSTIARAAITGSRFAPFLFDWAYVAPLPAVVYGRSDVVAGLPWFKRLFLQQILPPRRRAVLN